jgi:NAD(P)-dependent dehydrogenase (short-subunit alcohol dehydrogenase family)
MVFLCSPRAGYITGTVVTIDGGIAAKGSIIKPRSVTP